MHASVEQVLTAEEFTWSRVHGFPHLLEFPTPKGLALTRFVVRDRETGNLGSIDVPFAGRAGDSPAVVAQKPLEEEDKKGAFHQAVVATGPIGSFGTIVPNSDWMCGDVYELSPEISKLPDYWNMDPLGAIYTNILEVPWQLFVGTKGISGVTPRTEWFGINYLGAFWVRNPGEYKFEMSSDDGARLFIDDELVIDLDGIHQVQDGTGRLKLEVGRHSIRVPYFQGPEAVALVLRVKPPGGSFKIFDMRDFAAPQATPQAVSSRDNTKQP
jgi:hypothetical protein